MSGDSEKPDFLIKCNREQDWPDDVISDDEWSIYGELSECDGFDVDPLYGGLCGGIIYPFDIDHDPVLLHQCINLAIEEYCKKNDGKKLKLKEPVTWNVNLHSCPMYFYITFTAEDEETRELETYQTYQAKVVLTIPREETYVEMVRVKPKKRLPDASPLEGSSIKKLCH